MTTWWSYFWPIFAIGLVVGTFAGVLAYRRFGRLAIVAGVIAAAIGTAIWHGPAGAAHRLAATVERDAQATLEFYELRQVRARLYRGPLTRTIALTGVADDFQRTELVRTMESLPGVGRATWSDARPGVPLIVEGMLVMLAGFLFGLLLAYLVELHRRHNAQWNW